MKWIAEQTTYTQKQRTHNTMNNNKHNELTANIWSILCDVRECVSETKFVETRKEKIKAEGEHSKRFCFMHIDCVLLHENRYTIFSDFFFFC